MANRLAIAVVVIVVVAVILAAVILMLPSSPGNTGTNGGGGTLAIAATDPPATSNGTTHEYEHYSNVAAHRTQSSSSSTTTGSASSGWVMLNASGTLELDTLVNASQTMAAANVTSGTYDAIRLYVDSATVTFGGQNYTARMSSGQLTASLTGNVQVGSSAATVVIFDLRTVIINTGSSTSPQFVVTSSARAEAAPPGSYDSASLRVGAKVDLSASSWFKTFVQGNARLQVTAASISSSSLSVTVKDAGTETANVTLVIVTPISPLVSAQAVIPGSLQGSAVFVVNPGGTMQASSSLLAQVTSPGPGASVAPSASSTLTYSGTIEFGAALGTQVGVVAGQSYLITIVGTNSVTTTTVTAS